jgi:hypothetical protein
MGQWVHQHHVPQPGHKVVMQSLLPQEKQTSKLHIWVGPIFVLFSNLFLCVDSKSRPGHALVPCHTQPPLSFLFQPRYWLLIQCIQCFPYISLFDQETGWIASLYYFHPLSFLFEPSPIYILHLSPLSFLFERSTTFDCMK